VPFSPSAPSWLREMVKEARLGRREAGFAATVEQLRSYQLHTVCESAQCPNRGSCYARNTATFMILGDICTRGCAFCAVKRGKPLPADGEEPRRIRSMVEELGLLHVVVTSVTRDDLPDGGAAQFAAVVRELRDLPSPPAVEVLVPDFHGSEEALLKVLEAGPQVLGHNVETVSRLYPQIRAGAVYARSLELLRRAAEYAKAERSRRTERTRRARDSKLIRGAGNNDAVSSDSGDGLLLVKSGFMLGLGEEEKEVESLLGDLREVGVDIITIGQYLAPSLKHYPVARYVSPEEFERWADRAKQMGFKGVASGPLVRSSYQAGHYYQRALQAVKI